MKADSSWDLLEKLNDIEGPGASAHHLVSVDDSDAASGSCSAQFGAADAAGTFGAAAFDSVVFGAAAAPAATFGADAPAATTAKGNMEEEVKKEKGEEKNIEAKKNRGETKRKQETVADSQERRRSSRLHMEQGVNKEKGGEKNGDERNQTDKKQKIVGDNQALRRSNRQRN